MVQYEMKMEIKSLSNIINLLNENHIELFRIL